MDMDMDMDMDTTVLSHGLRPSSEPWVSGMSGCPAVSGSVRAVSGLVSGLVSGGVRGWCPECPVDVRLVSDRCPGGSGHPHVWLCPECPKVVSGGVRYGVRKRVRTVRWCPKRCPKCPITAQTVVSTQIRTLAACRGHTAAPPIKKFLSMPDLRSGVGLSTLLILYQLQAAKGGRSGVRVYKSGRLVDGSAEQRSALIANFSQNAFYQKMRK